ncbi:nucleotidyltransferase family protein [Terracidiphilus gabretensis]|uniref:nucleotidyltransferase family protein n=1 Tax=Terracidiphilus gabretensis TaxID=1577687 RepID=UPI0018D21C7F|nr:nucleotidyltransferase family protein [Terracidiphilus gabretensis]
MVSFATPEYAADHVIGFSDADWKSVLRWLDISGLAIYFLVQCQESDAGRLLPEWLVDDLKQRLGNNRIRTAAFRREACELAQLLEDSGVRYALLKGMTLAPESVLDSAYRSQADLDFMVTRRHGRRAIHFFRKRGYRLHAVSGSTLELVAGEPDLPDMANMYSERTERALDLHLLAERDEQPGLLTRRTWRVFDETPIAVLSAADILVQQAKHLMKHLCSEFTRLSWALEFRRHVQARCGDWSYWREVEAIAAGEMHGDLAMGVALWVAEEFFGKVPMEMPRQWSAEALPARVLLWLKRYTRTQLMSDEIRSKLYVLLNREMPSGVIEERSTQKILFPHYLPLPILRSKPREKLAERLQRYVVETDFFFRRLQFHVIEGVRFGIEASRWRRALERYGL